MLYKVLCAILNRFHSLCSFIGSHLRERTSSKEAYFPTTKLVAAFCTLGGVSGGSLGESGRSHHDNIT